MTSIYDWSTTAGSNTTVAGVSIAEGMSPAGVNNAIRGQMADLKKWQLDIGGSLVSGGSANAQTLTTLSAPAAYADGMLFTFVAGFSNSGAATLNVNAVGAKAIRKHNRGDSADVALVSGDIRASGVYMVAYDESANTAAGAWILLNPATISLDEANTWSDTQTFTQVDGISLASGAPRILWDETDQAGADGIWRAIASGGSWRLDQNTAVAGDFSTITSIFEVSSASALTIAAVTTAINNPVYVNGSEVVVSSGSTDGVTLNQKHIQISNNESATLLMRRRGTDGTLADFYRSTTSVGSISVTTVATAYNTSSDGRLKTNDKPIDDCGDIIDALRPVRFDWTHVKDAPKGVGFIAQELAKVVPEAVTPGDSSPERSYGSPDFEAWAADYGKTIPYIVAELQCLRVRVAALESPK